MTKDDAVRAVIENEREIIAQRRLAYDRAKGAAGDRVVRDLDEPLVGVALSGGGIRSASISLGFMQQLTKHGVLPLADYLSTVSGAGYASGYLYSRVGVRPTGNDARPKPLRSEELFEEPTVRQKLAEAGRYLAPGRSVIGVYGVLKVLGTVISSTLLNMLWIGALACTVSYLVVASVQTLCSLIPMTTACDDSWVGVLLGLGILGGWLLAIRFLTVGFSNVKHPVARTVRGFVSSGIALFLAAIVTVVLASQTGPFIKAGVGRTADDVQDWVVRSSKVTGGAELLLALLAMVWIAVVIFQALKSPMDRPHLRSSIGKIVGAVVLLAVAWGVAVNGAARIRGLMGPFTVSGVGQSWAAFGLSLFAFSVVGLLSNANGLSANKLFSDLIATSFLSVIPGKDEGFWSSLSSRGRARSRQSAICVQHLDTVTLPYPLYNTCVNLFDESDEAFAGARGSDYFLLSPSYCGSRLTGYISTREGDFGELSLADAVAASAASVSPMMGMETNTFASIVLNLLNLKLDRWFPNPKNSKHLRGTFWPWYLLRAMIGSLNTRMRRVNVSDGGFIDNLGLIELLRRRCELIVVLDNTFDPSYEFKWLRNAVMRARTELGIEIAFRTSPEDVIRPSSSQGFSGGCFVVADVRTIPGYPQPFDGGVLVYAKACVTAPREWKDPKQENRGFRYKTYHPHFPQESTAQQFFDEYQWDAHYCLGGKIAESVLGITNERDDVVFQTRGELLRMFRSTADAPAEAAE